MKPGDEGFDDLPLEEQIRLYKEHAPLPKKLFDVACSFSGLADFMHRHIHYHNTSRDSRRKLTLKRLSEFRARALEIVADLERLEAALIREQADASRS